MGLESYPVHQYNLVRHSVDTVRFMSLYAHVREDIIYSACRGRDPNTYKSQTSRAVSGMTNVPLGSEESQLLIRQPIHIQSDSPTSAHYQWQRRLKCMNWAEINNLEARSVCEKNCANIHSANTTCLLKCHQDSQTWSQTSALHWPDNLQCVHAYPFAWIPTETSASARK